MEAYKGELNSATEAGCCGFVLVGPAVLSATGKWEARFGSHLFGCAFVLYCLIGDKVSLQQTKLLRMLLFLVVDSCHLYI